MFMYKRSTIIQTLGGEKKTDQYQMNVQHDLENNVIPSSVDAHVEEGSVNLMRMDHISCGVQLAAQRLFNHC